MAFIPAVVGAVGSAIGGIGATSSALVLPTAAQAAAGATIGSASAAAAAAGGGLASWAGAASLASGIVGTGSAAMSAIAQNRAAKYNAKAAEQEATQVEQQGRETTQRLRMQTAQLQGEQRAKYAAAGVDPNAGSAIEVQAQTAKVGEQDALTNMMNYENKAGNLRTEASGYLSSQVSPFLAGATTGLSSIASATNSSYLKKLYASGVTPDPYKQ